MPNWIEGTIKLRGERERLRRFFLERIEALGGKSLEECVKCRFDGCDEDEAIVDDEVWITETCRAFIQPCVISWGGERATACAPILQAWTFCGGDERRRQWEEVSKSCGLDIRLSGFESGMEFYEDAVIISGRIVVDTIRKYKDWDWDCPMPRLGG